jgi:hypothetical protein
MVVHEDLDYTPPSSDVLPLPATLTVVSSRESEAVPFAYANRRNG